ncbi:MULTISPECIES: MSMEG_6728 family protein [unclassified Arthrobacter]|uniref:MSMEG_6728 family protein n=1 Tax=unclassified Arthrobacter TaxID=235627 RepID=UPI0024DF51F3|nr:MULTISPECIES: MSMEG_6728 family protein [unclassified Arthrobacter]MCC9146018.1 MSMEG_6728 family protein [Arthrobacter sp. zg-Y919]MDK1277247.1 MSMEG_6728 family protein [Arthrobacter sp. zg.Y919]WIB03760.1 MSMEG_6728 family protein [Arthrobacter sp. zg-Y919]
MQTFLPYPSFTRSAAVLDQARLGKQRVETLQLLRGLVVPDYGWQRHPALLMWKGFVPALTAYGLAMTDEWIARGHADTVREQILEFAPDAAAADVVLPAWIGDEELHRSHRSNLITKSPEVYGPLFPDTDGGLPYVWPSPADVPDPVDPDPSEALWVARAVPDGDAAAIVLPMLSVKGAPITGKKGRQLVRLLEDMDDGDPVAVLSPADRNTLLLGRAGPVELANDTAVRPVKLTGEIPRSAFAYPAVLQDPRTLFAVPRPTSV